MRDLCIIFLCLNFSSCGFIKSLNDSSDDELDNKVVFVKLNTFKITPSWFETIPINYRLDNNDSNELTTHEFFDVNATLDKTTQEINFIVLNPRNSPNNYQIDLSTGKRYLAHPFCDQDDVWGKYASSIGAPNFTMGIIPRYLTTDGNPMEIMVFGRENYYKDNDQNKFHRIKIVGGIVVQKCLKMGCLKNSEWQSNLILVAVDFYDTKYTGVENIRDLKKIVDWDYTKAFIENYQGRIHTLKEEKPFSRYLGDITALESINFMEKYGKFFDSAGLVSLQKSCLVIYEYVEKKLYNVVKAKTVDPLEFMKNFKTFYEKYREPFYTCSKYVSTGNINHDLNKMWFMSYLIGFLHLTNLDYVYSCTQRSWMYNAYDPNAKKKLYNQLELFLDCKTERAVETAFSTIPYMFNQLKINKRDYYRFITYDNIPDGSHQKIFNWVKMDNKINQCEGDKEVRKFFDQEIFPNDKKVELFIPNN